jgi:hypothetical protein
MRLFDEHESRIPLELVSAEKLTTGVLDLVYAPGSASSASA